MAYVLYNNLLFTLCDMLMLMSREKACACQVEQGTMK
jgi:hypothetical protein